MNSTEYLFFNIKDKKIKIIISIIIVFVFLFYNFSILHAESDVVLEYVHQFSASNDEDNYALTSFNTIDNNDNSYIIGIFKGTIDFDPGSGVNELTSSNSGADVNTFILKLDSDQGFVWVKQITHNLVFTEGPDNYAIIDDDNNLYITGGNFTGTVDFDPGAGTAELTSAGGADVFILKLDEDGLYVWAKKVGGTAEDRGTSISIDSSGNSYITGDFYGTVDFNPGAGTAELTSAGGADVFILKLDEDGLYVWAKKVGGTNSDRTNSSSLDFDNNLYITGYFLETADFDPGAGTVELTPAGEPDVFILKLNSSGEYVWVKQIGGIGANTFPRSIVLDSSGNLYITGSFDDTVDFDPGAGTAELTAIGSDDAFILKLNSLGEYVWAKQIGGIGAKVSGSFVYLDSLNNVYITGLFGGDEISGTADFDPGVGEEELTSGGFFDAFILKLDEDGVYLWAKQIGGVYLGVYPIIFAALDSNDNIYLSGSFLDFAAENGIFTIDVDPSSGVRELSGDGILSFFLKLMNTEISNQVSVSAIVEPTFTFNVSDNSVYFGILKSSGSSCWAQGTDPGNVTCPTVTETEAHTLTASTNASGGYVITVSGDTLTSGLNTITAIGDTNTAPSIGTEQFGMRFTASGGSGTVSAPYLASGYAFDTSSQPSEIASSATPSDTTTYSARYIANISPLTEAGSYSTTLTYTATGSF